MGYIQGPVYREIQKSSFKSCLLQDSFALTGRYIESNRTQQFHPLGEVILSWNIGFGLKRQFTCAIFREKILQLITAGIYGKWIQDEIKAEKLTVKIQPDPYNTVLTLKHLSIGFYIWLLMCLLSFLAFSGEILHYWFPKVMQMMLLEYVLGQFYKMRIGMH